MQAKKVHGPHTAYTWISHIGILQSGTVSMVSQDHNIFLYWIIHCLTFQFCNQYYCKERGRERGYHLIPIIKKSTFYKFGNLKCKPCPIPFPGTVKLPTFACWSLIGSCEVMMRQHWFVRWKNHLSIGWLFLLLFLHIMPLKQFNFLKKKIVFMFRMTLRLHLWALSCPSFSTTTLMWNPTKILTTFALINSQSASFYYFSQDQTIHIGKLTRLLMQPWQWY